VTNLNAKGDEHVVKTHNGKFKVHQISVFTPETVCTQTTTNAYCQTLTAIVNETCRHTLIRPDMCREWPYKWQHHLHWHKQVTR